jgi:dipeptidyl aminopeptidase/acylaminoacyl peptidase
MKPACSRVLVIFAVIVVIAAAGIAAAQPRPMTAVDLLSVPTQSDVRVAPHSGAVLFVRTQTDWDQDKSISHIWRVDAHGTSVTQMTNGKSGESAPRWSPDGTRFCFVATRDGDTAQLFVQPVDGGEAIQVSKHETSVSDPHWLPDGTHILFLADDADSKEVKEAKKRSGDVISYDRDYKERHLWLLDLSDKSEKRVTKGAFSVHEYVVSRDGATLVYGAAPTPLVDDEDESEIYVRPLAGGDARRLTDNRIAEHGIRLSPDASTVLFVAATNERFEPYYESHLFVIPVQGGAPRMLLKDDEDEIDGADWSADGRAIIVRANSGVRIQLWSFDPASGRRTRLTEGDNSVLSLNLEPAEDAWAAVIGSASSPGDIWLAPRVGTAPLQLTHFERDLTETFRMPKVEVFTWTGHDGRKVEGLLTYPLDAAPGRRAPLVVQTHGGPAASSTFRFASWATYTPVLAAKGYLVLDPNYRGSTGYGDAFLRDMVGHYFHEADKDVLAGVDALIASGSADPDKLVAMGWSAGGHMTNWLVTTTTRFKAAASGAGAANWISMYAQSDTRSYRTPWFGASPWVKDAPLALYLAQSPVAHVAGAKTPTLLMVGEKDVRVPTPQSIEMLRALRASGVDAELLVFPGEPHGLRTPKHRLHKINSEIAWFERHLFGRSYELEKPPVSKKDAEADKASEKK